MQISDHKILTTRLLTAVICTMNEYPTSAGVVIDDSPLYLLVTMQLGQVKAATSWSIQGVARFTNTHRLLMSVRGS